MRIVVILLFAGVFLSSTLLARDLGKLLPLKTDESGDPNFGASYTYGSDPDGTNYMLMASPQISPVTAGQRLRWNFYLRSSDRFLLAWDSARKTTSLALIGLRIDPKVPDHETVVNEMLKAQSRTDDLFLVLATDNNVPVYFLSISRLCATHPGNFKDLTSGRPCNEAITGPRSTGNHP